MQKVYKGLKSGTSKQELYKPSKTLLEFVDDLFHPLPEQQQQKYRLYETIVLRYRTRYKEHF